MPIIRIPGSEPGGGAPRQLTNIAAAGAPGAGLGAIGQGVGALGKAIQGIQQENERRAEQKIRDEEREENKKYRDEQRKYTEENRRRLQQEREERKQEELDREAEKKEAERLSRLRRREAPKVNNFYAIGQQQIEQTLSAMPVESEEDKAAYREAREALTEELMSRTMSMITHPDIKLEYEGMFEGIREAGYGVDAIIDDTVKSDAYAETAEYFASSNPEGFRVEMAEAAASEGDTVFAVFATADEGWKAIQTHAEAYPEHNRAALEQEWMKSVGAAIVKLQSSPFGKIKLGEAVASGAYRQVTDMPMSWLDSLNGTELLVRGFDALHNADIANSELSDASAEDLYEVEKDGDAVVRIDAKTTASPDLLKLIEKHAKSDDPLVSAAAKSALHKVQPTRKFAANFNAYAAYMNSDDPRAPNPFSDAVQLGEIQAGPINSWVTHNLKPRVQAAVGEGPIPSADEQVALVRSLERYAKDYGVLPKEVAGLLVGLSGKRASEFASESKDSPLYKYLWNLARPQGAVSDGVAPAFVAGAGSTASAGSFWAVASNDETRSYVEAAEDKPKALFEASQRLGEEEAKSRALESAEQGMSLAKRSSGTSAPLNNEDRTNAEIFIAGSRGVDPATVSISEASWRWALEMFPGPRGVEEATGLLADLAVEWFGTVRVLDIAPEVFRVSGRDTTRYHQRMRNLGSEVAYTVGAEIVEAAEQNLAREVAYASAGREQGARPQDQAELDARVDRATTHLQNTQRARAAYMDNPKAFMSKVVFSDAIEMPGGELIYRLQYEEVVPTEDGSITAVRDFDVEYNSSTLLSESDNFNTGGTGAGAYIARFVQDSDDPAGDMVGLFMMDARSGTHSLITQSYRQEFEQYDLETDRLFGFASEEAMSRRRDADEFVTRNAGMLSEFGGALTQFWRKVAPGPSYSENQLVADFSLQVLEPSGLEPSSVRWSDARGAMTVGTPAGVTPQQRAERQLANNNSFFMIFPRLRDEYMKSGRLVYQKAEREILAKYNARLPEGRRLDPGEVTLKGITNAARSAQMASFGGGYREMLVDLSRELRAAGLDARNAGQARVERMITDAMQSGGNVFDAVRAVVSVSTTEGPANAATD